MRNVLLVVFDTARADAFSMFGGQAGTTPCIEGLARDGTIPATTIAPSNWTLPSHASMFTGMLPAALGLTVGTKLGSRAGLNSRPILEANADRVLAEVLRRRGYRTAAVSANPWIREIHGFATGFDRFVSVQGHRRVEPGRGIRSRLAWATEAWLARQDDGAAEARRILLGWLAEVGDRPFFWFVNLMECHSPYLPPRPYDDLSGLERIRAARDAARYQTAQGIYRVCVGELSPSETSVERMRHLYARSIRQMDDWLATILDELGRRGILDDTLVVVASDHGENLGENGLIGHELSMDDRLIRVPLVFSDRVALPPLMSLAQFPEVLAGVLGIDDHPWHDELLPHGVALSQVAGQLLLPERKALALAWGVPEEAIDRIANPIACATDGVFKLVREGDREVVYDLRNDSTETNPLQPNRSTAPATLIDSMRAALADLDAMAPIDAEEAHTDENAELEERLRLLGYL
jgi:hypothetical protein